MKNKLLENRSRLLKNRSRLLVKGTIANRAVPSFHEGSLEITLTGPLNIPVDRVECDD